MLTRIAGGLDCLNDWWNPPPSAVKCTWSGINPVTLIAWYGTCSASAAAFCLAITLLLAVLATATMLDHHTL